MTSTDLPLTVGTILCSTWGYDQTNVDFYEVVTATPRTVQLRKIAKHRVEAGHMSYSVQPLAGQFTGEPFRRKVHDYSGRPSVEINGYANAYGWTGKAVAESDYH